MSQLWLEECHVESGEAVIMFKNEIVDEKPVCPLCKLPCKVTEPKTTGAFMTPKGLWIGHLVCIDEFNDEVSLLRELGILGKNF